MGLNFINKTGQVNRTEITDENGDWLGLKSFCIRGAYGQTDLIAEVELCGATVEMYVSEDNISIGNLDDLNKQLKALGYVIQPTFGSETTVNQMRSKIGLPPLETGGDTKYAEVARKDFDKPIPPKQPRRLFRGIGAPKQPVSPPQSAPLYGSNKNEGDKHD